MAVVSQLSPVSWVPSLLRGRFAPHALAGSCLAALGLYFAPALRWIVSTWDAGSYGSNGYLALPLLASMWWRRPKRALALRPAPLLAALCVVGVELFVAPLGVNILSALAAVLALHLWSEAFFPQRGCFIWRPHLLVGLACLPIVHWFNVLFGFHLQQSMTRLAGGFLRLYGAALQVEGTLLRFPSMVVAVDESCSGVRLLAAGLIFGLLARPRRQRLLFWALLALGVLVANVARIVALALLHLWAGGRPPDPLHQGVGLAVFALVCGLLLHRWRRVDPSPAEEPTR